MSDESVKEVVDACQTFIEDPDNNMLIEVFPDKLEAISDLSDAEKSSYIDQNNHSVKNYVIPAYQSLLMAFKRFERQRNQ